MQAWAFNEQQTWASTWDTSSIIMAALLQRVRGCLDGWKVKCLSRAGKLTLAKSVINGMSIFQMLVHRLPLGVHKKLDMYVRLVCVGSQMGLGKSIYLVRRLSAGRRIEGALD